MHLLHPALVHFAIAFVVSGGLLEAWGRLRASDSACRVGAALLVAGTLFLIPVIASGHVAANSVSLPSGAEAEMAAHERNGWLVLAVLVLAQFWKAWNQGQLSPAQSRGYAILLLVAVALVVYSAVLGGTLVYEHGVGVASG